jgi:hypothetical protein
MIRNLAVVLLLFECIHNFLCALQVKLESYIGGTVLGMSVWSLLYASLGAASRKLLDKGEDMATLFAGMNLHA